MFAIVVVSTKIDDDYALWVNRSAMATVTRMTYGSNNDAV